MIKRSILFPGMIFFLSAFLITGTVSRATEAVSQAPFTPPQESSIPDNQMGESVRYGKDLFGKTKILAKKYVGANLNCTSCHLDSGRTPYAIPMVGVWGLYPQYRLRDNAVDTIENRIKMIISNVL